MNRLPQIDVLRAVAVVLVLGRHLRPCPEAVPVWVREPAGWWYRGGWTGVDLFFVLSGFLVSGLLFHEFARSGRLRVGRFLVRRGFKIYPPFWLLLAYGLALTVFRRQAIDWPRFGIEAAFLQNYLPGLWEHTWSLAVEEHFYLALALGFSALTAGRKPDPFRAVPWYFLAVAVICLGLRCALASGPLDTYVHHFPTHLRLDSLGFGVLLAWLFHRHRDWSMAFAGRHRPRLLVAGALGFVPAFCWEIGQTPWLRTVGYTGLYVSAGLLLAGTLASGQPDGRLGILLARVGASSYSLYLWHIPAERAANAFASRLTDPAAAWLSYVVLYLAGTLVVGLAMAKLVEVPALRLRDRLFPAAATPRVAVPGK